MEEKGPLAEPPRFEHPDWDTGSADPQAITEHPDLAFERLTEAKWLGDPFGLRLVAVSLTHLKRGKAGRAKIPWIGITLTAAVAVAGLLAIAALVRLLPGA